MTTLVTGGRGYVGRHLVDQLLAEGGKVVSYNRDFSVDDRDGLTAVQGELFDIPRLTDTLRRYGVDRIIHTAGQSHPGVSIELPWTTFKANAEGTLAVYEAARVTGVAADRELLLGMRRRHRADRRRVCARTSSPTPQRLTG